MNDTIDHTPTVTHPCPDWCDMPAGYGWDNLDPVGGEVSRFQTRQVGGPTVVAGINGWREHVVVDIAALETATPDGRRVLGTTAPLLSLFGYEEGTDFDAAQARKLAAALLDAAERYDEITGASS